jgi:hypothetical protein
LFIKYSIYKALSDSVENWHDDRAWPGEFFDVLSRVSNAYGPTAEGGPPKEKFYTKKL